MTHAWHDRELHPQTAFMPSMLSFVQSNWSRVLSRNRIQNWADRQDESSGICWWARTIGLTSYMGQSPSSNLLVLMLHVYWMGKSPSYLVASLLWKFDFSPWSRTPDIKSMHFEPLAGLTSDRCPSIPGSSPCLNSLSKAGGNSLAATLGSGGRNGGRGPVDGRSTQLSVRHQMHY